MARPPSELFRELGADVRALSEKDRALEKDVERLHARVEDLSQQLAPARHELVALRQRSDDQTRQGEAATARQWGLVTLLIGSALSLAAGLIVTLARK